ncbi:MAG: hypothetical protein GXY86_13895, partial [Firmicutes bacterium]|nr:hypothetical protein [Bacillota bacterium]
DGLVKNRQYDSAFILLNEIDPDNNNPEIVLKKIDILLNYYVATTMHQNFGLIDLKEGDILSQLQREPDDYTNYEFEIDSILEDLIKIHPTNWELYKALGKYYFEVSLIYDDNWIKPKEELIELAEHYCDKAEQNNVFDEKSLNVLGNIQLQMKNNPEKAIIYYLKSIKINRNNPDINYYLACSYLQLGFNDEGIKYADASLRIYAENANKFGQVFLNANANDNDTLNVSKYFEVLKELSPYNYLRNLAGLLNLYTKMIDLKSAAIAADALFSIDLSLHSLNLIWNSYVNNGFDSELLKFYERMETKYASHYEALGNTLLSKAFYYKSTRGWKQAKDCFEKAKRCFEECFERDPKKYQFYINTIESAVFEIEYIQFEEDEAAKIK